MTITPKQRWLACLLYAVGIMGLSLMPARALAETPQWFPQQDKLLHALIYGGWAMMLGWAFQRQILNRPMVWMVSIAALAALYGALMEIFQELLPGGRTCSWGDMLANLAGAILGIVMFVWFFRRK